MKYNKVKLYAKALADTLSKKGLDEKKIVNNFTRFLISQGYTNKSKEILELTQNILLQKKGLRKITFETAREMTPAQKKIMDGMVKKGDVVKEKINPRLIAGIKITVNNETQFDNSLIQKLNKF